jgi:hypothetical protein
MKRLVLLSLLLAGCDIAQDVCGPAAVSVAGQDFCNVILVGHNQFNTSFMFVSKGVLYQVQAGALIKNPPVGPEAAAHIQSLIGSQ